MALGTGRRFESAVTRIGVPNDDEQGKRQNDFGQDCLFQGLSGLQDSISWNDPLTTDSLRATVLVMKGRGNPLVLQ